jgi:hypothetical protein
MVCTTLGLTFTDVVIGFTALGTQVVVRQGSTKVMVIVWVSV